MGNWKCSNFQKPKLNVFIFATNEVYIRSKITYWRENIPFIEQHKYLGMILEKKKFNFIPHINYIKNNALQLSHIAHTNWGADKETLLKLCRTLIRSKIEYGCFIYQSARKPYLKILNPIYHMGLRLILGTFKTSQSKFYMLNHMKPLQNSDVTI